MTEPPPPARTPGRYPRGEETKLRIICSALDIFGREGFAGSSTREIAAAADVNLPAIQYYFCGKQGLYEACIGYLTARASSKMQPAITRCQDRIDADAPIAEIVTALGDLQACMIDTFFADDEGHAIRRLLAWEDAENQNNVSERYMKERIALPIFEAFRKAVERVSAAPLAKTELEMHALSLMGLTMIFHVNQTRVMDMMSWSMTDDSLLDKLKAVALRQLTFALHGLAGSARSGSS